MALKFSQIPTSYLQGSGVIIGATTIVLNSFSDIYGNALAMTDFGTKGYGSLEPDTNNEEAFTFTSVVVNANATVTLGGVSTTLAKSPYTETSGLIRQHSGGTKVVITDNVAFWNTFTNKNNDETVGGQWTFTNTPIVPGTVSDASTTVKGVSKLSVAPAVANNPIAIGDNDPRITAIPAATPSGLLSPYAGRTAPSGWLMCDGSAVSRTTYAALLAVLCPSGTFTVTIAAPGVFTRTAHGFLVGDKVHLTTTGGLPSGLAANIDYYVTVVTDANTFQLALSPGGPSITTTGSQSGTHTIYYSAFGKGDGATTFNLPDLRSRMPIAIGQPTSAVFTFDNTKLTLASPGVITIPADTELYQGQAIVLNTTGTLPTGLSPATTYYVIRASQTAPTIQLATTQALANAGTGINTSGSQSGVHSLTYTPVSNRTIQGRVGGEEMHGISVSELAAHSHVQNGGTGGSTSIAVSSTGGSAGVTALNSTNNTGGDTVHNNMSPFLTIGGYIIKT